MIFQYMITPIVYPKEYEVSGTMNFERIKKMPQGNPWELPTDARYVRLGCEACERSVCIKVTGESEVVPKFAKDPQGVEDLNYIVGTVDPHLDIRSESTSRYEPGCVGEECLYQSAIETAVELIDERFGSTLTED